MKIKKISGLSLIEIVIFITVVAISAVGIFNIFGSALIDAARPQKMLIAQGLAQRRMEIILGQRRSVGYNAAPANYDICKTVSPQPPVCGTVVAGYTVNSSMVDNSGTQTIGVTVTGNASYNLTLLVAQDG